jgi:hypothetical protein
MEGHGGISICHELRLSGSPNGNPAKENNFKRGLGRQQDLNTHTKSGGLEGNRS